VGRLSVNATVIGNQAFPQTPTWSTWSTKAVPVTLQRGVNTITLTFDRATGSTGILNIDRLALTGG
jgi:hypothetical protein